MTQNRFSSIALLGSKRSSSPLAALPTSSTTGLAACSAAAISTRHHTRKKALSSLASRGERVRTAQLRYHLHVRAHQHEGLGRLHHRSKVEVLELLGRLLLRDAVLELPLQHGEHLRATAAGWRAARRRAARRRRAGRRRTSIHT